MRSTRFTPALASVILAAAPLVALSSPARAQNIPTAPSLTIYNQNFAVVRQNARLELRAGENRVVISDVTRTLEPESLIVRDAATKRPLSLLEQNYRANPVTQESLLAAFEGKTIDFEIRDGDKVRIVRGRIVRSGFNTMYYGGGGFGGGQMAVGPGAYQTLIEIDGKLRFGIPGVPLFPNLGDDALLKPSLSLLVDAAAASTINAELAYVTYDMSWDADYNAVADEKSDVLNFTGLVTLKNGSGTTFRDASIKLMAGDVNKIIRRDDSRRYSMGGFGGGMGGGPGGPPVTEKSFDDYHLYTLARRTTLSDGETKQVEFVHAPTVSSKRIYLYEVRYQFPWSYYYNAGINTDAGLWNQFTGKVQIVREFKNTRENGLGIALPKGSVRFYRRDGDALEFVGESAIDHTAQGETLRLVTGNAFDLVGARRVTDFRVDSNARWIDETIEITLRNRKTEPATIRAAEHLIRSRNWEITKKTDPFTKDDAYSISFDATLAPNEEKKITYTVHYTW